MSDSPEQPAERPRPQYGEYATPEEQRAHIRQPEPVAVPPVAQAGPTASALPASPVSAGAAARVDPGRRHPIDRLVTAMLLGVGAVNVFFSVESFLDVGTAFTRTMQAMGIPGEFTVTPSAQAWGAVAAVALIAGYLLTALGAWGRLRAGKVSWWVPVVGAVITYIVISVCLAVPLSADPAFQEYVRSMM